MKYIYIALARLVYHRAMLLISTIFVPRYSIPKYYLLFFNISHLKHLPTSNPKLNHAYHPCVHLFGVFSDTLVPNV